MYGTAEHEAWLIEMEQHDVPDERPDQPWTPCGCTARAYGGDCAHTIDPEYEMGPAKPQCQHMIEKSRSNSLRALYGEGGLSRLVQCRRRATVRFDAPGGTPWFRCSQHAEPFLAQSCIDPWTVQRI